MHAKYCIIIMSFIIDRIGPKSRFLARYSIQYAMQVSWHYVGGVNIS